MMLDCMRVVLVLVIEPDFHQGERNFIVRKIFARGDEIRSSRQIFTKGDENQN